MKIIGVTGGIGSGKSTVCKIVSKHFNVKIIDADVLAKQKYASSSIQEKVLKAFPEMQSFDVDQLSKIVFQNHNTINRLTQILYPELLIDFQEIISEQEFLGKVSAILIDAALLIESNFHNYFHKNYQFKLVLVESNEKERIERVLKKNQLSFQEIKQRMKLQLSDKEKIKFADYIISNSRNLDFLEAKTLKVFQDILNN